MTRPATARSARRAALFVGFAAAVLPLRGLAEREDERWLYRTDVVLESASPAGLLRLADGRELLIGPAPPLFCTETAAWERGRPLVYAYDPKHGTVLVDPETGCRMGVPLPQPHPIDRIDVPPDGVTRLDLWNAELDRVYAQALATLAASPGAEEFGVVPGAAVAEALTASQRKWIAFRDAESAALEKLYSGGGRIGWQQVEHLRIELVRQRVRELTEYVLAER